MFWTRRVGDRRARRSSGIPGRKRTLLPPSGKSHGRHTGFTRHSAATHDARPAVPTHRLRLIPLWSLGRPGPGPSALGQRMEQSYLDKCLCPNPRVLQPHSLDAGRDANDLVDHLLSCLECYRHWCRAFRCPPQCRLLFPVSSRPLLLHPVPSHLCTRLAWPGGVGQGLVRASTDSGCQPLPPTAADDTPVSR